MKPPPSNPKPGTYTLVVRSNGDYNFTKNFVFKGSKLELVDSDLEWKSYLEFEETRSYYKLGVGFKVKNNGDLPVYVARIGNIFIAGGKWKPEYSQQLDQYEWAFIPDKEQRRYFGSVHTWILPGEESFIYSDWKISYIPQDGQHHKLTLALKDNEDNVLLPISIKTPK